MLELVILTGQSGSGITSSKYVLEELGYYIVENIPAEATEVVLQSFINGVYKTKKFCLIVSIFEAKKYLS